MCVISDGQDRAETAVSQSHQSKIPFFLQTLQSRWLLMPLGGFNTRCPRPQTSGLCEVKNRCHPEVLKGCYSILVRAVPTPGPQRTPVARLPSPPPPSPLPFFRVHTELGEGQGAQWWAKLREWTHEPSFPFHELSSKAFHLRTKGGLRPVSWAMLENYHDKNEAQVSIAPPPALSHLSTHPLLYPFRNHLPLLRFYKTSGK